MPRRAVTDRWCLGCTLRQLAEKIQCEIADQTLELPTCSRPNREISQFVRNKKSILGVASAATGRYMKHTGCKEI